MVPRWFTRSVLSRRSARGSADFHRWSAGPGEPGPARRLQRPRTRLADAARELLQDSSPRFLVDHCHRSLELALLIAAASGADVDVEALQPGVLLHDLGLTPRFHSPALRFEVASAGAPATWSAPTAWTPPGPRRCGTWPGCTPPAGSPTARAQKPPSPAWAWTGSTPATSPGSWLPGWALPAPSSMPEVTDLRDKPPVTSSTSMAASAADHIPGFGQARPGQLTLAHPFETVKSQPQAP